MDITQLEKRIKDLEKWKEERTRQQLSFPLDIQSINILSQNFMRILSEVTTIAGAGGQESVYFIGKQGSFNFQVNQNSFIPYVVDTSTNIVSVNGFSFEDDDRLYLSTSDTCPTPLDTSTTYYVINSTGSSFKLSLTSGGAAIDITDNGVGTQYLYYF